MKARIEKLSIVIGERHLEFTLAEAEELQKLLNEKLGGRPEQLRVYIDRPVYVERPLSPKLPLHEITCSRNFGDTAGTFADIKGTAEPVTNGMKIRHIMDHWT